MLDLQRISDRIEIDDLLTAYTRAIDSGEWDRLDDVFTRDAYIDYSATGGIDGEYPKVKEWLAESLKAIPRRQHILAQREVYVVGDAAAVTAYVVNPMVLTRRPAGEQLWELGGYHRHKLVRTGRGWRSRELVEELVWKRGF
jgi:hypothetical protein